LGFGSAEPCEAAGAFTLHQRKQCFADQLGPFGQAADLLRLGQQIIVKGEGGTHGGFLFASNKASNDGLFYANAS
jgi:hypothetical protein